ncbi:hypothetical protein SGCOL_009691 [Colletotrichum sp. CLE4]
MYSQQWPPARSAVVQAQPQERETPAASLIPSHNSSGSGGNSSSSRQGTGPPRFGKPPNAAGGPASSSVSAGITRGGAANTGPGGGGDIHSQGDTNDGTFSASVAQQQQPAPAPAAGIINPFDLSAAEPSQPRHVLVRVDGDTGFYLGNAVGRPAPQEFSLPTEVDGSRSVANGDQIQTGWSIDYYGLSRSRHEYGNGIGWRCQESEAVADAQGNFGWPRNQIRQMPGETPDSLGRDVQSYTTTSIMKDPETSHTRREMKAHLHSPRKNGHKSYLTSLAGRIEHGQPLSAIDKEIASRLMLMFNDRDARGQKSISQPINTVLGPEDVSSPAILREHTQWMSYLGLHTPELHRRDFWDPRTGGWYYREYNMDDDFEDACENVRIISHATGRPVKPSDFLWR